MSSGMVLASASLRVLRLRTSYVHRQASRPAVTARSSRSRALSYTSPTRSPTSSQSTSSSLSSSDVDKLSSSSDLELALHMYDPAPSFELTRPPNPTWTYGAGLPSHGEGAEAWRREVLESAWQTFDTGEAPTSTVYRLLTSAVVPRPIALVSSLSKEGVPNLAPFSYFSLVAHHPPLLSVSFALNPRRPKDTRENILATKQFTVNIISEAFAEAANATCVEAPADVDEWEVSGLTREESTHVKPARVKESAVSFECELFTSLDLRAPASSASTGTLVLGLIKAAHVRAGVLAPGGGAVDPAKLRPIARLGGDTYARLGAGFDVPRPGWAEVRERWRGSGGGK